MNAQDRRVVAAMLRLAATAGMHAVTRALAATSPREVSLAWQTYYECGCDAALAATALELQVEDDSLTKLRADLEQKTNELRWVESELADAHDFIKLSRRSWQAGAA